MSIDLTMDHGHLDAFSGTLVSGWAFDSTSNFCSVDVYLDDVLIGTAVADQYRSDLKKAGIGAGSCAFRFEIPDSAFTGKKQKLSVRLSGTDNDLRGSPTEIIGEGVPDGPITFTDELILNPRLEQATSAFGTIVAGPNVIAPGVWIEASKSALGVASFACSHFEGFHFSRLGSLTQGIRLRSPIRGAHLRLFVEMKVPHFVLASPVSLSLGINRQDLGSDLEVKIGIGFLKNGLYEQIWSHRIKRLVPGPQEFDLVVDAPVINDIAHQCSGRNAKAVAIIDMVGSMDLTISPIHVALGSQRVSLSEEPIRDFEDPHVREQWHEPARPRPTLATVQNNEAEWEISDTVNVPEIVVPIFNAPRSVEDCLSAIRRHTHQPHLVTLVDDGSFAETTTIIEQFAASNPWCRVMRSARNCGYTIAVNKALKTSIGTTIVVLNSDTIVTPGWLSGLLECLNASPDTGIVGPLSNAASWQSIPAIKDSSGWAVNNLRPTETPESVAALVRTLSTRAFPEVPVLNGFCIGVDRAVIDAIGLFDELHFPMGYGEENDFCMRATDAGFKLRIADHVYVYHQKSKSFGPDRRNELSTQANKILLRRYGKERLRQLGEEMAEITALTELRKTLSETLTSSAP